MYQPDPVVESVQRHHIGNGAQIKLRKAVKEKKNGAETCIYVVVTCSILIPTPPSYISGQNYVAFMQRSKER